MFSPPETSALFSVPTLLHSGLKQKDIGAFEYLYDKYSTPLYSLIYSILPDPVLANDILERVFRHTWQQIGEYDASTCSIFTWIYTIARQEAITEKRQQELKKVVCPDEGESFRNLFELKALIGELPEPLRSTLLLSFFENASDVEISVAVNIAVSSVKEYRNKGLVIVNKMIAARDEIKKPFHISERVPAF